MSVGYGAPGAGLWPGAEAMTTLRCGESNQLKFMVTVKQLLKLGRGMGPGLGLRPEAGQRVGR